MCVSWSTRYGIVVFPSNLDVCDCLLREIQKGMPTVQNTVVHVKKSVCDCGRAFASKKRKAQCTAVEEPENAMKLEKPYCLRKSY